MESPSSSHAASNVPFDSSSNTAPSRMRRKRRSRKVPTALPGNSVSVPPIADPSANGHDSHSASGSNLESKVVGDVHEVVSDANRQSGMLLCAVCGDRALGFVATLELCLCYTHTFSISLPTLICFSALLLFCTLLHPFTHFDIGNTRIYYSSDYASCFLYYL